MSRVIHVDNPGKRRNQARRSIAEILRFLGQKQQIDDEARDMAAMLVYFLVEIKATVDESAAAWEKRGYWMKVERFVRDWEWIPELAANIDDVVRNKAWDLLPELLAELSPHFDDIHIKTLTRKPSQWRGAYGKLLSEPPLAVSY
ncbi:MAG TPA: hypothetical protein VF434_11145 [Promineifilum sp.]